MKRNSKILNKLSALVVHILYPMIIFLYLYFNRGEDHQIFFIILGIMFFIYSCLAFFLPKPSHHIIYKTGYALMKNSPPSSFGYGPVCEEESFRYYIKSRPGFTVLAYLLLLTEMLIYFF